MMMGSETEFGILGGWHLEKARAIQQRVVRSQPCLRAETEGVYLANGSRAYVDLGQHNEYATAEASSPFDLVVRELAGRMLMARCAAAAGHAMLCSNVDLASGTTWGTHENYQCSRRMDLESLAPLYTHLVTRILYTGAGGLDPHHPGVVMVLSPRACRIVAARSVQGIARKSLVFAKPRDYCEGERLHVFAGESLLSHRASLLKYASTALVACCLDRGVALRPGAFASPAVRALTELNRDVALAGRFPMADGRCLSALEIQEELLDDVERQIRILPSWAPAALGRWREVLDGLRSGDPALGGQLDWMIYRRALLGLAADFGLTEERVRVLNRAVAEERASASADDAERTVFLQFRAAACELYVRLHTLGAGSLFDELERQGFLDHRLPEITAEAVHAAMRAPPPGRASHRAALIRKYRRQWPYRISWSHITDTARGRVLEIPTDPQWVGGEQWTQSPEVPCASGDERRFAALQALLAGRHRQAESIYRSLIRSGYQPAGTRCHLARLMLMADRTSEAREQLELAWRERAGADAYVIPRILFLQALLALADGEDYRPFVRAIGGRIRFAGAQMDWTISPLLDRWSARLDEAALGLLRAIGGALCDRRQLPALERLPAWQEIMASGRTKRMRSEPDAPRAASKERLTVIGRIVALGEGRLTLRVGGDAGEAQTDMVCGIPAGSAIEESIEAGYFRVGCDVLAEYGVEQGEPVLWRLEQAGQMELF